VITAETIDRVREAADLVEIIGESVKLRRAGGDFRGPCPFHGGKNPNFSVSPRRNAYHCFKCGVKGDVFSFVRERMGLDFVEAVKYVAHRSGIEVKEERRREQIADPREPLWEANSAAAEFFRDTLWTDDEAKVARDYLASRDIDKTAADRFQFGYAPRDGTRLRAHLQALGYDDARLIAAGLLMQREGSDEARSRFWARLMIPILDLSGRHVGFGGRILGEGEPKYMNSAESDVFSKGRLLYGFTGARHAARKADRIIVVEGYFDAIRLTLAGVEEVVAPLGTALTEQQAALLAKLTRNVFLLYDSDAAGLKATFRNGKELLRHGVSARVASLPEGEDPDTFVRTYGAERLEAHLAQSMDIFERQILEPQRRGWFEDMRKTRIAIDRLLPSLRATSDPLTRDIYVGRLATVTGVDRDVLLREMANVDTRRSGRGTPDDGEQSEPAARRDRTPNTNAAADTPDGYAFVEQPARRDDYARNQMRGRYGERRRGFRRTEDWASSSAIARVSQSASVIAAEKGLVRGMLQDRDQVELVVERWGPEQFHNPLYRRIFERLLADHGATLDAVAEGLTETEVHAVNQLTADPLPDPARDVEAWLRKLEVRAIDEELGRINEKLLDPARALPEEEKDTLTRHKQQLIADRGRLSRAWSRVGRRADQS
jgi:DNA primase